MEDMYTEVFDQIKADPDGDQTDEKEISYERKGNRMVGSDGAGQRARRIVRSSNAVRQARGAGGAL